MNKTIFHQRQVVMNFLRTRQQGNIMLLSVLLSTGLLVVGVSLGTISVQQIQQIGRTTESLGAYYNAETQAEEAVYQIRKLGTSPTTAAINVNLPTGWARTVTDQTSEIKIDLRQGEWVEIDLHGVDDWETDADTLKFSWDDYCDCTILRVEVQILSTSGDVQILSVDQLFSTIQNTVGNTVTDVVTSVIPGQAYRVKITAIRAAAALNADAYVNNLTLSALNNAGTETIPSSSVRISTKGAVGNVNQAVELILE